MTERHSWVPYVAVAAGTAYLLKAVLIIATENTISEGAMAILYLGALVLAVAAAIGAGLRQRRGRRTLVAVAGVLGLLAFVMMGSDLVAPAFEAMSDAPWVGDEGPVGLLGAVLIGLGVRGRSGAEDGPARVSPAT